MRLWKKMMAITAGTLLLATGISGTAVIVSTVRYNEERAAASCEEQLNATAYALGRALEENELLGYSEVTRNAYFNFLIKKYDASRYILLGQDGVLCNLTEYVLVDEKADRWHGGEAETAFQTAGDRKLVISGKRIPAGLPEEYRLVLVEDISDIAEDMREQLPYFAAGYLGAALAAGLLLFFVTGKMLRPLEELKAAADRISRGERSCRASVYGRDEISSVAEAFNRMAEQLERQLRELEDVAERRMQLLGSLTHELKTPMTSIIGYSDTLLHVKLEEEQKEKALSHIYRECRRLERLSAKMMSLIGLYENDSIELEEMEVSRLLERVKGLEACLLEQRGMRLETECDLGKKRMDADLMESLLVNLVDNAVHAGKKGDVIRITGKAGREGERDFISVEDQGRGIPREELARVTEAFYMVDKSRTRREGGAGLGLALCSRIAALHKLELVMESRVGKGTRVTLYFCGQQTR